MAERKELISRARRLRRQATDAERLLWYRLRRGQLGVKFRRQAPIGPYVDFVCFQRRLVIELDGGQHRPPAKRAYDARRSWWLQTQGFRVLRFWDSEVLTDIEGVLNRILQELWRV